MKLGIDGARGVVTECGGDDVACKSVMFALVDLNASGGVVFKFFHGGEDCFVVSSDDGFVVTYEGGDGYGLGWGDGEVVEDASSSVSL